MASLINIAHRATIRFASRTNARSVFPKAFQRVLPEDPRHRKIHDEQTGASHSNPPGCIRNTSARASAKPSPLHHYRRNYKHMCLCVC